MRDPKLAHILVCVQIVKCDYCETLTIQHWWNNLSLSYKAISKRLNFDNTTNSQIISLNQVTVLYTTTCKCLKCPQQVINVTEKCMMFRILLCKWQLYGQGLGTKGLGKHSGYVTVFLQTTQNQIMDKH